MMMWVKPCVLGSMPGYMIFMSGDISVGAFLHQVEAVAHICTQ
jgi:hypothetical protein